MALIDDIHARMNEVLASRLLGADVYYRAPEDRPVVVSNQVLSLMEALVEHIQGLEERIAELEGHRAG